jgi:hypothetical protein
MVEGAAKWPVSQGVQASSLSDVTGNVKAPNRESLWPEQGKFRGYLGSREIGDSMSNRPADPDSSADQG